MSEADDLVAALAPVAAAFDRLRVRHYIGGSVASTMHGAIRSTMDVNVVCDLRADQVDLAAMERAVPLPLAVGRETTAPVATPENSIVAKLEWFRLGDESSERQWQDVSRLVALHGGALNIAYMRRMAESVGVADLLERLLRSRESG